jgi:leukotriene-A4 hydrolase
MKNNVTCLNTRLLILITLITFSICSRFSFYRSMKPKKAEFDTLMRNYKMNKNDVVSFSQSDGMVQHRIDFDVMIDMEKKMIEGTVRIHYTCKKQTNFMGLDMRNLRIFNVKDAQGKLLQYYIFKNNKNSIGDGLIVKFDKFCKNNSYIDISYSTMPDALGVHFSDPEVLHNKEKKYSFLYTHGEAIYGRTFFPSQDTPSLKVMSTAKIRIHEPYTVMFSGEFDSKKDLGNGILEYNFSLDKPIPTYLITFSAGILEKREIPNSRCEVWGEKEALNWIDESFSHCEEYLKFYETYKPFAFKKMVFLIVPDDFPFSGMENPYVTYLSESVLSKDKSYTNTIAHEIVHFWSGNLVTNKNWESFWLNEGITTYLNRKAFRVIHGEDVFKSELYNGLFKLDLALKELKKQKIDPSFRSLSPKITDDPYITFSRIPYEKGSFFMYYIETLVGDETMHKIMSDYFNEFEFQSLSSETFINFLKFKILKYLDDGSNIVQDIAWDDWMYGTEMIPIDLRINSKKIKTFKKQIKNFKSGKKPTDELIGIFSNLKIFEKVRVLQELHEDYSKLNEVAKTQIKVLLTNKELFEYHKNVDASKKVLEAHFIENNQERLNYLMDVINNFKFYKVSHLRKIFGLLKEINPDKKFLYSIVEKFKNRFNPLTVQRLKEFIELP